MVISGYISIRRLFPEAMPDLIEVVKRFKFDFDDAYQYTIAKNMT